VCRLGRKIRRAQTQSKKSSAHKWGVCTRASVHKWGVCTRASVRASEDLHEEERKSQTEREKSRWIKIQESVDIHRIRCSLFSDGC
jgi:hypothetical protein